MDKISGKSPKICQNPFLSTHLQSHCLTFRKPPFMHLLSQEIIINLSNIISQTSSPKREITNRDKFGQNSYFLHLNTRSMLYATQTFKNLHFNWTNIWFAIEILLFIITKNKNAHYFDIQEICNHVPDKKAYTTSSWNLQWIIRSKISNVLVIRYFCKIEHKMG